MESKLRSMQRRIDDGESILNVCRYHCYYVLGPARLLDAALCKELMRFLPVRMQSQDPHLLFTTLLHGYHVSHLVEWVNGAGDEQTRADGEADTAAAAGGAHGEPDRTVSRGPLEHVLRRARHSRHASILHRVRVGAMRADDGHSEVGGR